VLSLKSAYWESLHFINFTSSFAICEICSQILTHGTCEFLGIEPSNNDFMIQWFIGTSVEKNKFSMRVNKSYDEFK